MSKTSLRQQCERIIGLLSKIDELDDEDRDVIAAALLRYSRDMAHTTATRRTQIPSFLEVLTGEVSEKDSP